MGFWDTITGLFPGNKDKQDDPAENDRRQAFLLAKVGYPIVNGDNTPDDSGATEDWGVSAGIERGVNAPEAQSLYAKIGGVAPDGASSGSEAPPDTVAAENPTINDEIEEALGTKSDLTGKVQLPPAEPADRQEAAAESGEAEWSALSLDWKSGQENRSGDRSLLPYFNFSLPTGTTLSSQRDATAYEMERYSTQWKVTMPETTVMIGNKVVDAFTVSFANTLMGTAEAGYNTLTHPVDTAKGIASAAGNIVADPEAAWKEVQENARTVAHTITDGSAEDRADLLGSGIGFAMEGTLFPLARTGRARMTGKGAVQGARQAAKIIIKEAQAIQKNAGYAVDEFTTTSIKRGDKVYGMVPGQSAWYTNLEAVESGGGSYKKMYEGLQIPPHEKFGYRNKIAVYEVTEDMTVATGQALANKTIETPKGVKYLGDGGFTQYVIPEQSKLKLIKIIELSE